MADTGLTVWAAGFWPDDFWAAGFWASGDAPPPTTPPRRRGGAPRRHEPGPKPNRDLKSLLDESLPAVYQELTNGPPQVAAEAREIAKPFKVDSHIDWDALEKRASTVGRLLALVAKQRTDARKKAEQEALKRSDEDWFLMD